jgi:low temperature requirement protein LtrA
MPADGEVGPISESRAEAEHRVTNLELFFDLVFVFAITQVTSFLAADLTWGGLLRGLFLLAALWWTWAAYAWLTNTLDPEEGAVRLAMFGSMGAMLVVALAVPHAFDVDGVVFGIAYFAVRALHLVLYAIASRGDPDLLSAVLRIAPSAMLGATLVVIAGFLDGTAQMVVWAVALTIDYGWLLVVGMQGWRVEAGHFVERHGLIIIIALGESIVAIGIGASGVAVEAAVILAALLAMTVACSLWWSYFDWLIYVAQAQLTSATGVERAILARDLYSYLHLPMVAGIVLFALGVKTTLGHVHDPLDVISAVALCGGLALYFAGHVAHRLRTGGGWGHGRPVATVALLALVPVATMVPAIVSIALAAAVCVALIAYEALRYQNARTWIRRNRGTFTIEEARRVTPRTGRHPDIGDSA